MIINRYFGQEILKSSIGITGILVVIFMGHGCMRYLSSAVNGHAVAGYIFQMIGLEIPQLLGLMLPLGVFLGVFTVLAKMCSENELIIWMGAGISKRRILRHCLVYATIISLLVAYLTLWLGPKNIASLRQLRNQATTEIMLQMLVPGQFNTIDRGKKVIYVKDISKDSTVAKNIFIAEQSTVKGKPDKNWKVLTATSGAIATDVVTEQKYVVLKKGYRYSGKPGKNDFRSIQFGKYTTLLPEVADNDRTSIQGIPTKELLQSDKKDKNIYLAELHWRVAQPVSILILVFLAVACVSIKPRAGQFSRIIPVILLYIGYVNLLLVGRNAIRVGYVSPYIGLWWVHISFLLISLFIFKYTSIRSLFKRRSNK